MINLSQLEGFEWDKGNSKKNKDKHDVEKDECEQIFFNQPLIIFDDDQHTTKVEKRYGALGKTNDNRKLAIYFTIRNNKIKVVSARDQGKKDRQVYETEEKR